MGQPFDALLPNFEKKSIKHLLNSQGHLMFLFPHQEEND